MKRLITLFLALIMVVGLVGCGGSKKEEKPADSETTNETTESAPVEKRVIKMGYPDPAGPYSHYSYFLDYFNEELDKLSGGSIYFEGYADSTLGNETDMLNALSDGTLDSACLSIGVYSSQLPAMQIFSMPYLFNYPEQYEVLIDNDEFIAPFVNTFENDWGITLLGDAIYGGRYSLLTNREINSIEDMKDLVIRITTSNTMQATFEAMDAMPTVIAFSEVYTAFSTGVCDAVYVPIETYVFKGIYDCAESIALITPEVCLGWPMMSKDCWESFTEEEQGWIKEACAIAVERQRDFLPESEQHCIDLMADECGIYITEPDLTPFREATRAVHTHFVAEIGEDVMQQAYDILDKDNAEKGLPLWSDVWGK